MEKIFGTQSAETWKVNSLRFTVFTTPDFTFDNDSWEKLVGTSPENVQFQLKNQIKHFDGAFDNGRFIIDVDPSRIHLVFTPINDPNVNGTGSINLGGYDESHKKIRLLVEKWLSLPNCPKVNRIAVGEVLFIPVNSKIEGYQRLTDYLHNVKVDPEKSFDFLYQINRPKQAAFNTKEVLINRLSKWSVVNFETSLQIFNPKNTPNTIIESGYGVNLELDINTQGNFHGEFTPEEQRIIFQELLILSNEISIQGDV